MNYEIQIRAFIDDLMTCEDPSDAWKSKDCQKTFKELMKGLPKPKKVKHPDEPKGKRSSYILFSQQFRASVVEENPDMSIGDIGREIGRMWKELDTEEKKHFKRQAEADKERYQREYAEFLANHPEISELKKSAPKKTSTKVIAPRKAFQIFSKEQRPLIKKTMTDENSETPSESDLKKRIKEEFDSLEEDERKKYDDLADEDKIRYEREKAERGEPIPPKASKKPNIKKARQASKAEKAKKDTDSSLMSKKKGELVAQAEDLGLKTDGLKKTQLVEAIIKAQTSGNASDSTNSDETETEQEQSEPDSDMDEDSLSKLTMKKLRELAKKNGITIKPKAKKEDIIRALILGSDSDSEERGSGLTTFCNENRARMIEENPDMSPAQITEALIAEYQQMKAEQDED